METFLYLIVSIITRIHNHIMSLNDGVEYNFTDKELHFIVIGILGIGIIFAVYPVFKWLARAGHFMTVAFFYAFTVIIVITFAIEIGQWATSTGNMEFADIAAGVLGFLVMYIVLCIIIGVIHLIRRLVKGRDDE